MACSVVTGVCGTTAKSERDNEVFLECYWRAIIFLSQTVASHPESRAISCSEDSVWEVGL